MSSDDPAKQLGANDLSLPDLRNLALPFTASGKIGPVGLAGLKSDLEDEFDRLGFDTACDFGPIEPPMGERFRNRAPGSARHSLEGIMVGERHLSKDAATSRRNLAWVIPLIALGVILAVLNFTAVGASVSPLLLFLGVIVLAIGLSSLPRVSAFQSDIVYAWYGYDPPGWVIAYSVRGMEKQMPTTPQVFDVHVGAGRVSSVDIRGKNSVGRTVRKVVDSEGDLESVPNKVIGRLSASRRLPDTVE
jgi:hypothetical protein